MRKEMSAAVNPLASALPIPHTHIFHAYSISAPGNPTLSSTILCISTKLHATKIVSNEFENVCAWNVHVTYDEATSNITRLRCRGFPTSSWIAQSSSTKLSRNMSTRSVQKTTAGVTSPPCPLPIHIHFSSSIGKPYTGHRGKTLRMGLSEVNSQVSLTG